MNTTLRASNTLMLVVTLLAVTAAPPLHAQAGRGAKPPTTKTAKPVPAPQKTDKTDKPPVAAPTPVPAAPAPTPAPASPATATSPIAPTSAPPIAVTSDYVFGPGDVLAVIFWRQQDMSAEVVVRPDGRISLPLLNEVDVTGLTPEQLRQKLTTDALKFVQDPNVTVVVKQINSRRVYITGQVSRPGPYPLISSMNVLQLISMAGGLSEYADEKNILVMRTIKGKTTHFTFNYKDMINRKNLKQNIDLKPDDTVIVP